ncbi:PAS domain S-box protein [Dyella terrae]|nr:PAS domain S-box protein [Dyella terrae]
MRACIGPGRVALAGGRVTRKLGPIFWSAAVLVLSWGITAAACWQLLARNHRAVEQRLNLTADQISRDLEGRFRLYDYGLRGVRAAIIAAGFSDVSHDTFSRAMQSRDFDTEFPGSRGFGYIVRVREGDLTRFVARAQLDRHAPFHVRELTTTTGDRFIIQYIEPEPSNEAAIGLDIASDPNRRTAALSSMASARATLTGPITLVQATGAENRGALFLLPIYRASQTPPLAQRDADLVGWVYTPLVTDEILATFARSYPGMSLNIADVSGGGDAESVFTSTPTRARGQADHEITRDISIYGRTWRLAIAPNPDFIEGLGLPDPVEQTVWMGLGGALLAVIAALVAYTTSRRRRSLAQRARLATIVEDSHDAIIGTALDGTIIEWNRGATRHFGHDAEDVMGKSLADLIVPRRYLDEDKDILRRASTGESVAVGESVRRHRDGSTLYVEISASPIRDERQQVVGVATTLRNITDRKAAERQVRELNATLEQQVQQRTKELKAVSSLHKAILSNAGFAIFATDVQGEITLVNPAAEAMLGYSARELVGKGSPLQFHDDTEIILRAEELEAELGRPVRAGFEVLIAKAQHAPDVHEWTFVKKSGKRLPVLLNISAMRREDGSIEGYLGVAASLEELKRRENALAVNQRKLRGLFELSPLGIALTDESGKLVEFNQSYRNLTGYSDAELMDMDYWRLTPSEYLSQEQNIIAVLEQTGRYGPYDKHYIRKDGHRVPVRLNGVTLRIDDKPYIWSIVEDTTDQRLAEAVMVNAIAAAEAASQAKSDFLANMSHEIRTPMNAILGMLQLLQKTSLDIKQRDYTQKTETAATTLLALLNDILDFSKIEAGRLTLEMHEFDLDKLLREIAVIVSANVGHKDIEVVFDIDPGIPSWLVGDSLRLQQVLINLAGNAVKFTEVGEVRLQARLVRRTGGSVGVHFEVQDTGIGIADKKLSSIFEGFSQAEASTTRRFGGSGLGLAICRRLVEMMGGQLQVESQLGVGSRFYFNVDVQTTERPVSVSAEVIGQLRELKVLVVDDNASARTILAEIATSLGWQCDAVANGAEALRQVAGSGDQVMIYDVILMDWSMPGMDGWEAGRRIRDICPPNQCPLIVMVTMHEREAVAQQMSSASIVMDGFLVKPVTSSMLLDAVADALASRTPALAAQHDTSWREQLRGRLEGLSILVVEDNATNQQVAKELLEFEGADVDVASSGLDALKMLEGDVHLYDVVLMDIQMPVMDGFTATRHIRGTPGMETLPIIAMTANVLETDRLACLEAGMNDHLGKPFDIDVLVSTILHWTKGRELVAAAAAAPKPKQATKGWVDADLDDAGALARFGGRQVSYQAALKSFERSMQDALTDIAAALKNNDAKEAVRVLHALKGAAATIGANRLSAIAGSYEREALAESPSWNESGVLDHLRELAERTLTSIRGVSRERAEPRESPVDQTLDRQALIQFAELLAASNMLAVDHYEGMRGQLTSAHPDIRQQLDDAMSMLDLKTGLRICNALLEAENKDRPHE